MYRKGRNIGLGRPMQHALVSPTLRDKVEGGSTAAEATLAAIGLILTMHMEYAEYVRALRDVDAELAGVVETFHNLENILDWMQARRLSLGTIDVIQQDEYNHDLLIPLEPAGGYLVFGMT